jgi:NADH:ubiquinone oxidoreductase subunit C
MKLNIGKPYKIQKDNIFVLIGAAGLLETLERLAEAGITRIADISGSDDGKGIELVYRLPFDKDRKLLNLKIWIPRGKPRIQTATGIFPSAYIYERECFEFLGVKFEGHPDMKRMLLADTSPETPLRKKEAGK